MSIPLPFEKTCTTPFGRFRVKVTPTNIMVGGSKSCVTIAMTSPTHTLLSWLGTEEGGCSLNSKVIEGTDTLRMVDLAFSLLRTYFPSRTVVSLFDNSGVYITDKFGKRIKVLLLDAHFLLYGKTWYEDKFGATMIIPNAYAKYRQQANQGVDDPSKKPANFEYFGSVNDELQPLYQTSTTWREFIHKIKEKYPGKIKYKIISEWYHTAVTYILEGAISQDWQIDVSVRPFHQCAVLEGGGGKRRCKTRKAFPRYYPLEQFIERKGNYEFI